MDTPGYDPVSMTGLVAGGCNVGVFTTGRGSVYGCKPVPCIKVATNTPLYQHMEEDMDLNGGMILDGTPLPTVGRQIFEEIVAVASGKRTQERTGGRRRRGVRALDHRPGDVRPGSARAAGQVNRVARKLARRGSGSPPRISAAATRPHSGPSVTPLWETTT